MGGGTQVELAQRSQRNGVQFSRDPLQVSYTVSCYSLSNAQTAGTSPYQLLKLSIVGIDGTEQPTTAEDRSRANDPPAP